MAIQTAYTSRPAIGYPGMLADNGDVDVASCFNREASAEIAFGRGVMMHSTDDRGVLLPTAQSSKLRGIVVLSHAYGSTELGDTGIKPGHEVNVLVKGRVFVKVGKQVAIGDRLYVRVVAGGDPEFVGGIENAADSTDMIDCTAQGVFRTAAAQGGIAVLEVDFTNEP